MANIHYYCGTIHTTRNQNYAVSKGKKGGGEKKDKKIKRTNLGIITQGCEEILSDIPTHL